jgi:ubiquinone/menaquinone biosynthesis C-methylase UbiE
METKDRGQVNRSAAEVYDEFFIPALFQDWTSKVADAAGIRSGQDILDVACGTGVLTRTVAERVGPNGRVTGLDLNEGMLAVAQQKESNIEWRQGRAEMLPFENAQFDAVVSQFGLMFFEDQELALQEMFRVLRPGGNLAVAVWDSLDNTPGYATMTQILGRLFGDAIASRMHAPYQLGDTDALQSLFRAAGIPQAIITTHQGTACFPSIQSWVYTEIKGWVLADVLNDGQFDLLLKEAERSLASFVTANGSVVFGAPAHIVTALKSQ